MAGGLIDSPVGEQRGGAALGWAGSQAGQAGVTGFTSLQWLQAL